jgi:hypothetical protein
MTSAAQPIGTACANVMWFQGHDAGEHWIVAELICAHVPYLLLAGRPSGR